MPSLWKEIELAKIRRAGQLLADGAEWFEYHVGLDPIPTFHPPSLKNPQRTIAPLPSDGWHRNDSKAAKQAARKDLAEIHKRLRRQIGKPEISHTALFPIFPNISQTTLT